MDPDAKLCYCFHVTKRKVVNFVRQRRPRRASQIAECFGAGTGCGWCIPFLINIHRQIVGDEAVEADDISPAEYEAMRAGYRRAVAEGARDRNDFGGGACPADAGGGTPASAPEEAESDASLLEDPLARYFSRPRGAPPPPE